MNLKKPTMNNRVKQYAVVFFTILLLASCGSDDSPAGNNNNNNESRFEPSNFKISDIITDGTNSVDIDYQQTNMTAMDYDSDNDGMFRIKWTVKTTDGIQFQEDRLLATELDAGAAASLSCIIQLTQGKVADISTLEYEVYFDEDSL